MQKPKFRETLLAETDRNFAKFEIFWNTFIQMAVHGCHFRIFFCCRIQSNCKKYYLLIKMRAHRRTRILAAKGVLHIPHFTEISRNLQKLTEISQNRFRVSVQTLSVLYSRNQNILKYMKSF